MTMRLLNQIYNSENLLYESLVSEAIHIHGDDFMYIPRRFVAKDEILGEDRLSKFENSYPIIMYVESVEGFEGQGAIMSKFGLQMDQQATLTVARKSWDAAVGQYGATILPNRPSEGDLIYYPRTRALFEINFVQHQSPFYQVGQLYTYKLTVDRFRYSSETMATGIQNMDVDGVPEAIDVDTLYNETLSLKTPQLPDAPPKIKQGDNSKFKQKASGFLFDAKNPFGDLK